MRPWARGGAGQGRGSGESTGGGGAWPLVEAWERVRVVRKEEGGEEVDLALIMSSVDLMYYELFSLT